MADRVKQRLLFIVIGMLMLILVVCLSFWGYMQTHLFTSYDINDHRVNDYLESLDSAFVERTQDNLFTGYIPMSVINNEMSYRIEKHTQAMGIETEGIDVDLGAQWAKINYRKHLTFPIYHDMNVYKKQEALFLELVPVAFGEKQIRLPSIISQWIFGNLIEKPITVQLNYDNYNPGDYFDYISSDLTDKGLFLNYQFYLEDMSTILEDIRTSADTGLLDIYENGNETQQEALRLLGEHSSFPENTMGLIYDDYHADANIIHSLLILADPQRFNNILETYPKLKQAIDGEAVLNQRAELLNQATIKYGRNVLKAFEKIQATSDIVAHYGYFFDIERMEPVTIELMIDLYGIKIPYDILRQMRLIMVENMPYVLYDTREARYILISDRSYSVITEEQYQDNYYYERPTKGDYTLDQESYDAIYKAIEDALGEEIFIRYMKDDGVDALVVYSSRLDYQNFTIALLKNEGHGFSLIGNDLKSIKSINEQYPEFNLNLITRRIETTQVQILNSNTRQAIKEGLVELGYIQEDEVIPYISYDGKRYISIMTESGQQYIYTIYRGTFLERAYSLDDALELFDDINPLLLIQKRPVD